jgi:hypothetical protein
LLRNDYAGTGYIDGGRKQISAWLYKSLVDNKPYDQMARELIAPKPESEGFIKGIKWRGNVNASQVTELQFAQNVGQVFFGINLKCASCHDSFIDNWKLDDAYSLAAVIADSPLEVHRCDNPRAARRPALPFPGTIDAKRQRRTTGAFAGWSPTRQRTLRSHHRQPHLASPVRAWSTVDVMGTALRMTCSTTKCLPG